MRCDEKEFEGMIKACERCGGLYATENWESFAGNPCQCGVPKGGECKQCGGTGRVEMLEYCPVCKGTGKEFSRFVLLDDYDDL